MHGFRGGINFSEWQAREESAKKKMKTLLLLDFSVLTDESSPVEKIAPNLCGMKASFEQYLKKNYDYSTMREHNLQNLCFGLGLETRVEQNPQKLKLNNLTNVNISASILPWGAAEQQSFKASLFLIPIDT